MHSDGDVESLVKFHSPSAAQRLASRPRATHAPALRAKRSAGERMGNAPFWGTRWWAGRGNAILTEPTSSHANCLKTRRLPPVGCTLCWALLLNHGSLQKVGS